MPTVRRSTSPSRPRARPAIRSSSSPSSRPTARRSRRSRPSSPPTASSPRSRSSTTVRPCTRSPAWCASARRSCSCSDRPSRGPHGRVRPGGTAERLIGGSPCPVAIVPHGFARPEGGMQLVAAAYAPTPEGHAALNAAARLARAFGARLRVVRVLDPSHAGEQSPGLMAAQHHRHRHRGGDRRSRADRPALRARDRRRRGVRGPRGRHRRALPGPSRRARRGFAARRPARDGVALARPAALRGARRRLAPRHRPRRVPGPGAARGSEETTDALLGAAEADARG